MLRRVLAVFLGLGLIVGSLLAAEGVVVKLEKGTLTVKVDGKEKTYMLVKGTTKVLDSDGTAIKGKARAEKLTSGVKVSIKEEDGKVTEVKIK